MPIPSVLSSRLLSVKHLFALLLLFLSLPCMAQERCEVSSLIRDLISEQALQLRKNSTLSAKSTSIQKEDNRRICCFMKTTDGCDIDALMEEVNGTCHMKMDDLCIVTLPVRNLEKISTARGIRRIEAKRTRNMCFNDISRTILRAESANSGASPLPHPFTGKGTMLGIMDIGFDLTHPNFLSSDGKTLRIRSMWDQLDLTSPSSVTLTMTLMPEKGNGKQFSSSPFSPEKYSIPIGGIHEGSDNLLAYAHSADGLEQTHGTHTLGSAAGNGFGTPYIGTAPEAEICCVANVCEDNANLIPDSLKYIYTQTLDILGFKYLFDCADAMGKPCVITFSEGGIQDFKGDDVLYYEALEQLTGPGHIIVSAAGNRGQGVNYLHKKSTDKSVGTGLLKWAAAEARMPFIIDSAAPVNLKLIAYGKNEREGINDTITMRLDYPKGNENSNPNINPNISENPNLSELTDTLETHFGTDTYKIIRTAYRNCYDSSRFVYDLTIVGETMIGYAFDVDLVLEDIGNNADVQLFSTTGELISNSHGNRCDATNEKNIVSPASAPCVICVGATAYRTETTNYLGEYMPNNLGENGEKATYSSVGPTFDGRIKPDVMAPGTNIISSYSSYYLQENPEASDITWDVEHFTYNDRTYPWNCNTGTSMACPLAAGIIAMWLEACPTLTPQGVLDVIAKTSRRPDAASSSRTQSFSSGKESPLTYPNNLYGYGEIDAYAGLMYIMQFDGIKEVSKKPARNVRIERNGDAITVHLATPSATPLPCNIYTTGGKKAASFTIPANTQNYTHAISLAKGYYAMQIARLGSCIFTF